MADTLKLKDKYINIDFIENGYVVVLNGYDEKDKFSQTRWGFTDPEDVIKFVKENING